MPETVSMEVLRSGWWQIYLHDINGVGSGGLLELVQSIRRYGIAQKESRNRPGVAQRVPGGLGSQISMIFST